MQVITFRAPTMQEALQQVRNALGPDAAVLQTKEVGGGLTRWLTGARQVEVVASAEVHVPSRFEPASESRVGDYDEPQDTSCRHEGSVSIPGEDGLGYRERFRQAVYQDFCDDDSDDSADLYSLVEALSQRTVPLPSHDMPGGLFRLFTDLIEADLSEELARDLVERVRENASLGELEDPVLLKSRIARMIEAEIDVCGPISVQPSEGRVVALVGPTGVGKTTTIAKLAADYRLRERRRVGLITVDTYRIAAVDQLRTYADIIELPMEVVSTPREMRQAVDRLSGLDLILVDTAGRSPRDEVKIQELKALLGEAQADEVHLVLSGVASAACLQTAAERFVEAGVTALLLTKLDEVSGLGNVLSLVRSCRLPLSYLTNGQNVPDDIEAADSTKLTRLILGTERP